MKPLSIVAYFDGRLGHEKQTQGILNALSDMTPIVVDSQKASVASSAYFKNWISYFFSFLKPCRGGKKSHSVDLIIGTGTHTHIPMLLAKKSCSVASGQQVRVVTCMNPDMQLRNKFDLCFIPRHDDPVSGDNVFITLGPPNTVKFGGRQQSERGLILVGGVDTKSHVWKSEEIAAQMLIIIDENPTMQWTISSSPRTPEDICKKLEVMAASMQNVSFFRHEETPAGWVEEQYALNRTVWVTADSVSMVYEALSAGCSVGILPVDWLQENNKFQKSLTILHEKKMVADFNEWQSGTIMPHTSVEYLNESTRCAREILRRWWPERLTAGMDS